MSFVSPDKQQLILDLLLQKVSERDFYSRFPTTPSEASASGAAMLRRALEEQDRVAVEFGLYLGHRFGITPDYLDALEKLAGTAWHERHEDVVAGLAKLASPSSVIALRTRRYRDPRISRTTIHSRSPERQYMPSSQSRPSRRWTSWVKFSGEHRA
jgi:hypothetical protein